MSAEFLKRAREKFSKAADRTLRIGGVASIAFTPYTPVFSSQKEAQSAKDNGHTLVVDTPLNLDGLPKTFKAPDGTEVIFGKTEREQVQSQEVSVFGVSAEFTDKGNIVISRMDGKKREINLPPLAEFYPHFGGMEFSPDGTKLVAWRDSHDRGKEGYTLFLISPQTGEFKSIFSDFVRSLDYLPRVIDLEWSQDGKKLRIASGHHGRGRGIVVDIDTEQVVFEYRGGIYGQLSPDGNWFARIEEKDLEVRRISDGYKFTIRNNGTDFSWSPDSSSLIFNRCLMWDDSGAWGPRCMYTQLSLYDLAKGELKSLSYSEPYIDPFFSPSGEKVFFRMRANTRLTHFGVFNVRDGRNSVIDLTRFVDQGFELINWSWMFYGEETILGYGWKRNDQRLYLFWVDIAGGLVKRQQWLSLSRDESVEFKGPFDTRLIFEVWNRNAKRWEYWAAPITEKGGQLEVVQRMSSPRLAGPPSHGDELFAALQEGNQFKAGGRNFLFLGGRRRLIEHEETAGYFGLQKSSIPEGLTWFIPEGENISFRPGDVVGHKDLGIWYLRSGKRYKVQNWDWFREKQRFNAGDNLEFRRGEWIVSKELIERIPEGEVPQPAPGETFIRDWDGSFKEFQPYGGRMFLFMGGHGSSSESQKQAFEFIKSLLRRYGQSDLYFGESTYNVMKTERGLFPLGYSPQHTYRDPLESIRQAELLLQWYKERFPLTKFILIGHSLGGFVLFNAAVAHTDAIKAVITIDSPLTGIDKSLLTQLTEVGDEAVARWAEAFEDSTVGRFMIEVGDNPKFREEAEAKAWHMISRGVTVITATNDDDILIPRWSAVLQNSFREAEKRGVQLIWNLGQGHLRLDLGELLLEAGHGQMLTDEGVWESFIERLVLSR